MTESLEALLYAPPRLVAGPARPWRTADFTDVDDRVRGGSSTSRVAIVGSDKGREEGEIVFDGFLDTTTLGGAGFASQLCSTGFPWTVNAKSFRGLAIRFRRPLRPSAAEKPPGGGKALVTVFCLQLKMEVPERRPDGRRESVVTYEWEFDALQDGSEVTPSAAAEKDGAGAVVRVAADWKDFKATYRGRPKDDADPLDPSKVCEWSIMARSNFGSQSGPFCLQLATLSALHIAGAAVLTSSNPDLLPGDSTLDRGSGEYYGFALFIFATVLWVLWVSWALLPDSALERLGIGWYPNREWAFLLPAWALVLALFIYIGFAALNLFNTPAADDLRTITDSHANVYPQAGALAGTRLGETGQESSPLAAGIYDLPLGMVSRQLYLDEKQDDSDGM